MHYAILCPPLTGHVKPLAALARELEIRGHRATFVHHVDAAAVVERHGGTLAPISAPPLGRHRGIAGTIREMARQTDMLCRNAPDVLRGIGADAILADQLEPAGGLLAERFGLPFATIACALPADREPGVPPPYVGWRYDPSRRGRGWNEGGWRVADWLMRPLGAVIAGHAEAWRLPRRRRLEDCFSPTLQLAQAVPSIDFPREALAPHFHYLGPFRHYEAEEVELPEGRPLVYCSLGTLHGGRLRLFRAVAAACEDIGAALVLTHCGRLSEEEAAALPGRPAVHDWLPQEEVLRHADGVVTHAGFNTVLEALAAGLPMVAVPLAFDQPAVGARIAHAGVGVVLRPRSQLRTRLRAALEAVLDTSGYRERAERVKAEIEAAGGVRRAADLVEAALR